mmetsp:Transcript_34507/g.97780  ORF Transcript_34507/g.97780 Transcript_34507/m.97780 type:complete len:109 (-) Transcript_34507:176-502(-)
MCSCSMCMINTPSCRSLNTIHDSRSKWASEVGLANPMCGCEDAIPPLVDLPITQVCELLHGVQDARELSPGPVHSPPPQPQATARQSARSSSSAGRGQVPKADAGLEE